MIDHEYTYILFLSLAAPLACGDSTAESATEASTGSGDASTGDASTGDASTGDASSGAPTTGDDTTGGVPDFYACDEVMFGGTQLAGPGWDAEMGGIVGELQPGYVLHTTQIYIKPDGAQKFNELAGAVAAEAMATEGLIAYAVGGDGGCGVARTMGIWASEEAMYKLVTSEAHAQAMGMTQQLSFTGRVTHWTATAEEANAYTWDVARAKIADIEPSPVYE